MRVADRDQTIFRQERERKRAPDLRHGIDQRVFNRERL
jgi:hypothetical protein